MAKRSIWSQQTPNAGGGGGGMDGILADVTWQAGDGFIQATFPSDFNATHFGIEASLAADGSVDEVWGPYTPVGNPANVEVTPGGSTKIKKTGLVNGQSYGVRAVIDDHDFTLD